MVSGLHVCRVVRSDNSPVKSLRQPKSARLTQARPFGMPVGYPPFEVATIPIWQEPRQSRALVCGGSERSFLPCTFGLGSW